MEARKRKASNATANDGSATKKIRLVNSKVTASPAPTSDNLNPVQRVGLQVLSQLKKSVDKHNHHITTQFLTLPPRKELPGYYNVTKLPLALDDIERKIHSNQYATVTEIESDLKRMVQNAKDFNDPQSGIFEDAEKIRKLVYNFMKKENPEYAQNPNYASFPTPISQAANPSVNGRASVAASNGRHSETPARSRKATAPPSSEPTERMTSIAPAATPAAVGATAGEDEKENESGVDFTGKTFQQAQAMIIDELIAYTDDEGLEIYTPFHNLPSRTLGDYYKFIETPMSLKGLAKRIKGIHGRNDPTGISDYKTWEEFEKAASLVWLNARSYNEDGSDMFTLANEFEEHFSTILEDAKSKVEGPQPPKIKLGGPKPKVTLNLASAQQRPSPVPTPSSVSVDNEALARQRQLVAAGVNGRQTEQRPSPAPNGLARSTSQVPTLASLRPQNSSAQSPPDAVKLEKAMSQSPAVTATVPSIFPNGAMPPPTIRPPSSSPYPTGQPLVSSYHYTAPTLLPPTAVRTYPLDSALLPNVTIATHPHLKLAHPFAIGIPPHSTLSQQSRTITLPASHYFLQISPTISKSLSSGRQPYKIFVTVNGTRLTQRDTVLSPSDPSLRMHVYEGSLAQGVNRVEVEVAAGKENGREGLEVEKVVVFANLMKT